MYKYFTNIVYMYMVGIFWYTLNMMRDVVVTMVTEL